MDGRSENVDDFGPPASRRRFDVTKYHRMAEVGILDEADRVELIDGALLKISPVGGSHIGAVMALTRLLVLVCGGTVNVSIQSPLRLDAYNRPEPDVVLLRPRHDKYHGDLPPSPEDALMVVEISDTTLRYDRGIKLAIYARHAVPEVWIVDLGARQIEVYSAPSAGIYTSVRRFDHSETIAARSLEDVRIAVKDIIGPGRSG